MIKENIGVNDDPKYNMKHKLKEYLLEKVNALEIESNKNIIKTGRPKSNLSFSLTIDAIFLRSD